MLQPLALGPPSLLCDSTSDLCISQAAGLRLLALSRVSPLAPPASESPRRVKKADAWSSLSAAKSESPVGSVAPLCPALQVILLHTLEFEDGCLQKLDSLASVWVSVSLVIEHFEALSAIFLGW